MFDPEIYSPFLQEGLVEREPEPGEEKGYSGVQEDLEKYRDLIEGGVEANPGELEAVEDSQVSRPNSS